MRNYHKLGSLKQQRCALTRLWRLWSLKSMVSAVRPLCKDSRRGLLPFPNLSNCTITGIPWFIRITPISVHVVTWHSFSLSLYPHFPFLWDSSHWFRAHTILLWHHPNLIASTKSLFWNKITLTGTEN